MISRRARMGFAAGCVLLGTAAGLAAVPTSITEPVGADPRLGAIDIENSLAQPGVKRAENDVPTGNPLWAVPLKELAVTRERPIFSPSRRPPPPAVVAAPYVPPPPPPASREPERPPLALVGTVAGENEGLGVFLDQTTNKVVRLKLGDGHQGWMLRKVIGREVTLQKDGQSVTLALPAPGAIRPAPATARAPDPE